ncbi:hypothetical protein TPA0905_54180 [Streptomyces olivaceus]|nr:hypothetical protein TPA0905_54180 [Streptomyces olivaceus]
MCLTSACKFNIWSQCDVLSPALRWGRCRWERSHGLGAGYRSDSFHTPVEARPISLFPAGVPGGPHPLPGGPHPPGPALLP